jgi:hypothetical protein
MSPPGRPDGTGAAGSPRAREEGGQALVLLIGLVVLVLMVLALGWDTSNGSWAIARSPTWPTGRRWPRPTTSTPGPGT